MRMHIWVLVNMTLKWRDLRYRKQVSRNMATILAFNCCICDMSLECERSNQKISNASNLTSHGTMSCYPVFLGPLRDEAWKMVAMGWGRNCSLEAICGGYCPNLWWQAAPQKKAISNHSVLRSSVSPRIHPGPEKEPHLWIPKYFNIFQVQTVNLRFLFTNFEVDVFWDFLVNM